jgi:hypothetical protein
MHNFVYTGPVVKFVMGKEILKKIVFWNDFNECVENISLHKMVQTNAIYIGSCTKVWSWAKKDNSVLVVNSAPCRDLEKNNRYPVHCFFCDVHACRCLVSLH